MGPAWSMVHVTEVVVQQVGTSGSWMLTWASAPASGTFKFHGPSAPSFFFAHFLLQTSSSSANFIHFSSTSLLLWAKAFIIVLIASSTFVLLPFFFCCCSAGLCCSGLAVAIASSCSCSVGVVLLLGVDPCCWLVSLVLSKLPVDSAASSSSELIADSCSVPLLGLKDASCWRLSSSAWGLFSGLLPTTELINVKHGESCPLHKCPSLRSL